ncbi:hypothetical protein A2415_00830 [candidate division WWE3 bacterium RIFOXYC1_FULL_39_7]|uniref:TIGR04086 family membrane protein n=2 Tax=Katanobacteria TaxID=422282 RepID=A0A1F4X8R8_UNCKA|nr:MAG: hypothetical protein A2415_00830 [candidate division WWE3 bacterium RIFOXYC1_FULL_39_7]OGC77463.1 MAG: hypothetical protein A2619_03900 [candidate division WWE3 bacterium RIFOXYD1_FULL_39_9]
MSKTNSSSQPQRYLLKAALQTISLLFAFAALAVILRYDSGFSGAFWIMVIVTTLGGIAGISALYAIRFYGNAGGVVMQAFAVAALAILFILVNAFVQETPEMLPSFLMLGIFGAVGAIAFALSER